MPSGQAIVTQAYRTVLAFPHRKSNILVTSNSLSSFPTGCLHEKAEYTAQAGLPNKQLQRNSTDKRLVPAYSEI